MNVSIKDAQTKIKLNPKKVKKVVRKTLSLENKSGRGEITVIFVDDRQIKELNLIYSGRHLSTDVVTFDSSINKREILADIVVSTQTAIRQARIYKTTPLYEVYLYVVHGLLHLLGYNDKTSRQQNLMQKRAQTILASLRITQ